LRRLALPSAPNGALSTASADDHADFTACTAPEAFASLSRLPPGLVLAEPDLGSYVLAHTPHAVAAGPYHRNERGMHSALKALLAAPDAAPAAVQETGARYLAYCRAAIDPQFVQVAPEGLAAQLAKRRAPDWLRHAAADDFPLDIYLVK
jgi:hypothetical protein